MRRNDEAEPRGAERKALSCLALGIRKRTAAVVPPKPTSQLHKRVGPSSFRARAFHPRNATSKQQEPLCEWMGNIISLHSGVLAPLYQEINYCDSHSVGVGVFWYVPCNPPSAIRLVHAEYYAPRYFLNHSPLWQIPCSYILQHDNFIGVVPARKLGYL